LIDTGRIAIAPDIRRQNRLVPLVDDVQHRLPDQVTADRMTLQAPRVEQFAFAAAVAVVLKGLVDLKVVAPASQFDPVITEIGGQASHFFQRQIGPLASEEGYGAWHQALLIEKG